MGSLGNVDAFRIIMGVKEAVLPSRIAIDLEDKGRDIKHASMLQEYEWVSPSDQ